MSYNYGLTSADLDYCKKKLQKQKDYMENFTFLSSDGKKEKTLLDVSFSPNLSKRYYPRILNKVSTFVSMAAYKNLTPVFLTVTLDGFFRDAMRGDYSRFTPELREKYEKHIPNNDRNGRYWDYINAGNALTPRDLYKILSHQLHRFHRSKTLQDIRQKYGEDYMSIRVTEPHKDGVPHFHILMYLPEQFIPNLYIEFKRFFPAPQNHKRITMREDGRKAKEVFDGHYETKGLQIELRSPMAYILKYILKSFRNLMEDQELDYLQAWYIFNKIPRIITTHSLLAQDVYYHASLMFDDWFHLTNIKLEHYYRRDKLFNTFCLIENKRELHYKNGLYQIINNGRLIKEFGYDRTKKIKFFVELPYRVPLPLQNHASSILSRLYKFWRLLPKPKYKYKIKQKEIIDIELPNGSFMLYDLNTGKYGNRFDFMDTFYSPSSVPLPGAVPKKRYSDLDLFDLFYNYDFDRYGLKRFATLKKEMISRGLLEFEDVRYEDYTTDFNDWLREADLNHRPQGYEPCELPNCSIPRSMKEKSDYSLNNDIQT